MSLPRIGLTIYGRDENNRFSLPTCYVDCVHRAGGIPLLLPPGEVDPAEVLAGLDGLILTGGGDIDPVLYHGARHKTIYMVDPERDRIEVGLVLVAKESGLPTLGICRGSQVINVALGGTLIEHLPDVVGEGIPHRLPPREPTRHDIKLNPRCRLAKLLSHETFSAPSWHHQAVRRPAPSLEVVARAPDGTIEGFELPGHPWMIGVQWHPELAAAGDPLQQKLFDAFVKAAALFTQKRANR
jgi:putative glutamine amidotransferase